MQCSLEAAYFLSRIDKGIQVLRYLKTGLEIFHVIFYLCPYNLVHFYLIENGIQLSCALKYRRGYPTLYHCNAARNKGLCPHFFT